jgi:hypothetical protein
MNTIIHESKQKARKNYPCDACNFLFEMDNADTLTFTEKRAVVKARSNKNILKGQEYVRQFNCDDSGNAWTFRAIPEIHEICMKLKLYYEY